MPCRSFACRFGYPCKVKEAIDSLVPGRVTVSRVARKLGVNPSEMALRFRACHGKPIRFYVLESRVRLVARMLLETRKLGVEIAYEAGFAHQAHMTITFKRLMGVTPTAYRQARGVISPAT